MADAVQGKNSIVLAWREDISAYVPFACAKGISLNIDSEFLPTTTQASSFWETFKPSGINRWSASMTGITFIRDLVVNKYFVFDTIREQLRTSGLQLKFQFTDDGGFVKYYTGFAYIPSTVITGEAGLLSNYSIEFIGSGPLSEDAAPVLGGGYAVIRVPQNADLTYHPAGAETFFSDALAINRTVIAVVRETYGAYAIITSGTPTDKEAKYTAATGRFDFLIPMEVGENVYALVQ